MSKKKIKVFDFFSGCGGTAQGFKQAGLDIVVGIDNDKDASETYKYNIKPELFINEDIRQIETDSISAYVNKYKKDNYILFCGCAPCQPFSSQNKKRFSKDDKRFSLLDEFSRFVEMYEPDFIFFENVPGMKKLKPKESPLYKFENKLKTMGYNVCGPQIVCAEEYGVPQKRRRLILIASKLGEIKFPEATHGPNCKQDYITVREAISFLPKIAAGQESKKYLNHKAAKLSDINLKRLKVINEGESISKCIGDLSLQCHINHKGHGDVYGRLKWDEPSVTLTTKCTSLSNGRFGHPTQDRALTPREAACIQSFPVDFEFKGAGVTSWGKQVGNAVPVKLAEAFGLNYKKYLA